MSSLSEANEEFRDQHGESIAELSRGQDCLIVFLRHSGCTFCREALADLRNQRVAIGAQHVRPILVHMGDETSGKSFFAAYGLDDWSRISDPKLKLYRAYGLERGRFSQLLSPLVWWRGFKAAILRGHAFGAPRGDIRQMPGTFLVRDGQIIAAHRYATAADRPDYCELAKRRSADPNDV